MNSINCPRCKNPFYSAFPSKVNTCPYCGYVCDIDTSSRRRHIRSEVMKHCVITRGGVSVVAKAVDVSPDGVGVEAAGGIRFLERERVRVVIEELDIDSDARVVWTAGLDESGSKAGFAFSAGSAGEGIRPPSD